MSRKDVERVIEMAIGRRWVEVDRMTVLSMAIVAAEALRDAGLLAEEPCRP